MPIDGVCNTVERFSSHAGVSRCLHCSALCPQGDGKQPVKERNEGRKRLAEADKRPVKHFFFHSFTPPNPLIDIEVGAFCEQNVNGM